MSRLRALIPWIGMVTLATVCLAGPRIRAAGTVLGTPLPPFVGPINPAVDVAWALLAAAVLAAAVVGGIRLLRTGPVVFALGSLALTLVVRLAVNAARAGPEAWAHVFDTTKSFEAKNEYLPALGALEYGERFTLDRWAEMLATLPPHAGAHPPGTLLLLHWLGIDSAAGMAALCIGAGSLATPLAYLAFRRLVREPVARLATVLLVLSPDAILFGATSADALFLFIGMLAAWPLAVWVAEGDRRALWLGACAVALGTLFAWPLPAVAVWAGLLAWRRGGLRRFVTLALACAAACAVLYAALFLLSGYDVVQVFRATEELYRFSVASIRPYWFWVLGSPAAFLVAVGLPITWFALRAVAAGRDTAIAIGTVIAVASVLGFTKAETERIWLYLVPFVCLAAADELGARGRPRRTVVVVFALLAAQALITQLVLDTVW